MVFFIILAILASSIVVLWYHFVHQPKQYLKQLFSQGATKRVNFESSPYDELNGIKKAIQKNPNMKAIARRLAGRIVLLFIDTGHIKEVLTNHKYYSKMSKTSETGNLLNKKGLTAAEEEDWKLHRRVIGEAFQYDLFSDMIPEIIETTKDIIDLSAKEKRTIRLPNDIELITAEAVTRIFFGVKSQDVMINGKKASEEATSILLTAQKYSRSALRFLIGMRPFNVVPEYRRVKQRIRDFRKAFGDRIQERVMAIKKNSADSQISKKKDLLQILLEHQIKHRDDPTQTLSDEEILDEFAVFFLAGKDTTSLLVSMTLYCCVIHPEWGQKLKEEINKIIKDPKDISQDLLNSMDIMSAVINEVLRLYPPAPMILPRVANRDHYVGEFFVRKGYHVNTFFVANHYNPKYFNDPEKFDPSRWFKNETRNEAWKNDPFSYLPFSAGPRNCIGKHLALMEAKIIISMVLKSFDIAIEEGFQLVLGSKGIGYGPNVPIPLILTPIGGETSS